jgi:hypothetical protein
MTTGMKIITTISIIFNVKGLEEALYALRLYLGFRLEGNRFGKSPITPKNVAPTIVSAEANQALKKVFLKRNNLMLKSARTVISMTIKKAGCLM